MVSRLILHFTHSEASCEGLRQNQQSFFQLNEKYEEFFKESNQKLDEIKEKEYDQLDKDSKSEHDGLKKMFQMLSEINLKQLK